MSVAAVGAAGLPSRRWCGRISRAVSPGPVPSVRRWVGPRRPRTARTRSRPQAGSGAAALCGAGRRGGSAVSGPFVSGPPCSSRGRQVISARRRAVAVAGGVADPQQLVGPLFPLFSSFPHARTGPGSTRPESRSRTMEPSDRSARIAAVALAAVLAVYAGRSLPLPGFRHTPVETRPAHGIQSPVIGLPPHGAVTCDARKSEKAVSATRPVAGALVCWAARSSAAGKSAPGRTAPAVAQGRTGGA